MAKKPSALAQSLQQAATPPAKKAREEGKGKATSTPTAEPEKTVLIAAHFPPEVRRVLKLIEADSGKNLKQLLGEAINMLAANYGKPEPYQEI